jgi:hypothetical protein
MMIDSIYDTEVQELKLQLQKYIKRDIKFGKQWYRSP